MIATFTLYSKRAFSEVLVGVVFKNGQEARPRSPSSFRSSSTLVIYYLKSSLVLQNFSTARKSVKIFLAY